VSVEALELRHATAVIAADAAEIVMQGYRRPGTIHKKGRIDLVTDFDLRSEALIVDRLSRLCPSDTIVAEETRHATAAGRVWYVDPIDGTTNFAHGHPFFCVSIGLYDGAQPLVGVIHAPALGIVWMCATGTGAFRNGERCHVSQTPLLGDALLATGFPYDRATSDDNNFREFTTLKRIVRGIRRCGSAALDLALVADGTYDGYWEQKLNAWDMAAGAALIVEAGGVLNDYDGAVGDPRNGQLIATNGKIQAALLTTIRGVRDRMASVRERGGSDI